MFYLSEVLKVAVKDSSETIVGRLTDILIKPQTGAYGPVCFLFVQNKKTGEDLYVPIEYVANISKGDVTLKHLRSNIPTAKPEDGLIPLAKDILDEQIVDIKGARVVRVNDLKLGPVDNRLSVLGIDVSFRGILRRLGFEWIDIFNVLPVKLIDWRSAQLMEGMLQLTTVSEELTKLHPADLANIIEELTVKQGSTLVDSLESGAAAAVVEEMDPGVQTQIMHYLGPEKAADIVEKMSVDETVDLLQSLPEEEAKDFMERLEAHKSKKIETLIKYDEDMAGGVMTTDYIEAGPTWTVAEVVEEIRRLSPDMHSVLYVYVVDKEDNLVGVVSLRTLILSKPNEVVKDIMKELPESSILHVKQKVDDIIRVMTKYNLYSAAVLDEKDKMAGVITLDDVMRFVAPNA